MQECKIDTPPVRVDPDVMTNAWISQTKNLIDCNTEIRGLQEWKKKVVEEQGAN